MRRRLGPMARPTKSGWLTSTVLAPIRLRICEKIFRIPSGPRTAGRFSFLERQRCIWPMPTVRASNRSTRALPTVRSIGFNIDVVCRMPLLVCGWICGRSDTSAPQQVTLIPLKILFLGFTPSPISAHGHAPIPATLYRTLSAMGRSIPCPNAAGTRILERDVRASTIRCGAGTRQ